MAAARFQVVSAPRYAHLAVPRGAGGAGGAGNTDDRSVAEFPTTPTRGFAWRFLSANNRSMARSARTCPDVESCVAAIHELRNGLALAVGETSRDRSGQWVWQVRLADLTVASSTRSYQRQVRARLTCDSFFELVAETAPSAEVAVVYL